MGFAEAAERAAVRGDEQPPEERDVEVVVDDLHDLEPAVVASRRGDRPAIRADRSRLGVEDGSRLGALDARLVDERRPRREDLVEEGGIDRGRRLESVGHSGRTLPAGAAIL
jgi:hypothetical protein